MAGPPPASSSPPEVLEASLAQQEGAASQRQDRRGLHRAGLGLHTRRCLVRRAVGTSFPLTRLGALANPFKMPSPVKGKSRFPAAQTPRGGDFPARCGGFPSRVRGFSLSQC